ncbi:MAG: RNA chaperone Hfq [Acidobacteria bacterium]|nr:RNA chaperone Hfq [Acidobacteriota bacterium]
MPPRRLMPPGLSDVRERPSGYRFPMRRKAAQTDQTNAEPFYYLKQMGSRTPMVLLLANGEEIRGVIEWYDRNCVKVNREGAPNLLIMKHAIKYLFKAEELGPPRPGP